jgi:hypothetical protein
MIAALAVFAAAFSLYLGCLYPAIAPRDSADMASAALTLGVAHPPGYPLYSLIGRAWLELLRWGNPAYRLNVLSAVAGAAAVAVLFLVLRRRAGLLGALAAASAWALSAPLWKFSLLEEKYSLHALFAVLLLFLVEGKREDVFARARLSGLLLGLGLVNHQSLLFWIPAVAWLWRAEAARHGVRPGRVLAASAGPLAAGLAAYAFLWIRLGAFGPALAVALRARYGAGTLSAGLARALTPEAAGELLAYAARGAAGASGWAAAAAALAGAALAWRSERSRAAAWLAGAALTGPLFIVLSRFDPSNWVARSVLEPAFLLPALVAAAFAGEAVGAARRRSAAFGALAAAAVAVSPLAAGAPWSEHRDDFLAYDYVRDLRRAVPPGGALLAAGDTASFGLGWLALTAPEASPREISPARLVDALAWRTGRAGRPDSFTTGLSLDDLRALGLPSAGHPLAPEGLVQRIGARPPSPAPLTVLRRPRAWVRDESYARDAKLSYAFAFWLSARLLEAQGIPPPEALDLAAAADDPEDYRLQ